MPPHERRYASSQRHPNSAFSVAPRLRGEIICPIRQRVATLGQPDPAAMREHALAKLERELGIELPSSYRQCMLAYPFARDSWPGDLGTPDDPALILDMNREPRTLPPSFSRDVFFIGSDGRGTDYFIRLSDPRCGVWAYDCGAHQTEDLTKTFDEWLSRLQANEGATPAGNTRRRWWEIWR